MNNCKKYYAWLIALTAAAFIITAVCIQFMADSVPMHYNFHGEIDRYGSKNENFIFPCFIAVCVWQKGGQGTGGEGAR